jgi:hypothetical protein
MWVANFVYGLLIFKILNPLAPFFKKFTIHSLKFNKLEEIMRLEDVTLEVVQRYVSADKLFTALDVSNEVKSIMPQARHRDVRDAVRSLWSSEIESNNYDRTAIQVKLHDGSTVEALLYHPLAASWDLDNLYDAQQRQQSSNKNVSAPSNIQTVNGTLSKANDGTLTVVTTPVAPLPAPAVAAPTNTRDLWSQMWQTQPSLFPRK